MQTRSQKQRMPAAVNTDAYQPFNDEIFLNTIENILSDEHTYNTNFDEYKSDLVGIGEGGEEVQMQGLDDARDDEPTNERSTSTSEETGNNDTNNGRARLSRKRKSPYFASGRVTRAKAAAAQKLIKMVVVDQSERETEFGVESEFASAPEPELGSEPEEPASEPASVLARELEPELELEPQPEPELSPGPVPVPTPECETEPVPEPELEPARELEPEPEVDAMNLDKADHDGEMETDTVPVPQNDGVHETKPNNNAPVDEAGLSEDRILASLGPDQQSELLEFIESHLFMKGHGYPVGRCARRQFVSDVRGKAGALGLNQSAIDELVRFIRRIYLETWAEGNGVDDDISEFGEEFDKEDEALLRKERKRKRHAEKNKDKPRKNKREERSRPKNGMIQAKAAKPDIINIQDTASVLPNYAPQVNVDGDLIAITPSESPEPTKKNAVSKCESKHDNNAPASSTRSNPSKSRYSDLGSEADPIPLDDEVENEPDTQFVTETDAQKSTAARPAQPAQPAQPTVLPEGIRVNSKPHEENHLTDSDLGLPDHQNSLGDNDNDNVDDTSKPGASEESIASPKPPKSTSKPKKNERNLREGMHNISEENARKLDLNNEAVAIVDLTLFEPKTKKTRAERERQRVPGIDEILATTILPGVMSAEEKKREKNRRKRQKRKQKRRDLKNQEQSKQQSGRQFEKPHSDPKNAVNHRLIPDNPEDEPIDCSDILEDPHWDLDL